MTKLGQRLIASAKEAVAMAEAANPTQWAIDEAGKAVAQICGCLEPRGCACLTVFALALDAAVAVEREACAEIAEADASYGDGEHDESTGLLLAAAERIRARKDNYPTP